MNKLTMIVAALLLSIEIHGFPTTNGDRERYNFTIETKGANFTGILVLLNENGDIKGSMVNEFGVSAIDFVCTGGKIEIKSIMEKLDKWYIRKTLRKDLARVLTIMESGGNEYSNVKRSIKYSFTKFGGQ